MLNRLGKVSGSAEKVANIGRAYRQQERHAKNWCVGLGIDAISVNFEMLVHRPEEVLPNLASEKLPAMCGCIDPTLHRSRKSSDALEVAYRS